MTGLTFAERNPVILGAVAALLIVGGTLAALAVQGGLFRGGYLVTAEFADAAGLSAGDQVLVAGIRAGQVEDLRLAGDRVEALLRVDDHELPKTTRARIILRTLVGRRSVELVAPGGSSSGSGSRLPSDDWSELLADGDRIPVERTSLPVDVPEFGEVAEDIFSETDTAALNEFLVSLTDVTRGQRAQIETLIQGGSRLTGVVNEQEQEVRELLRNLRTVSEALAARDQQLVTVIDDFGATVAELADRREDLRRLLRGTDEASGVAADLIAREREALDRILDEVHIAADVISRHQLDLAEALAYGGDSIEGFASIAYAGPLQVPWGNVFTTSLGPAGVDVVAGCGGLIDQQLDGLFGEDPRSCAEQENDTFPDDVQPTMAAPALLPGSGVPVRLPIDVLARRLLSLDPASGGGDA